MTTSREAKKKKEKEDEEKGKEGQEEKEGKAVEQQHAKIKLIQNKERR